LYANFNATSAGSIVYTKQPISTFDISLAFNNLFYPGGSSSPYFDNNGILITSLPGYKSSYLYNVFYYDLEPRHTGYYVADSHASNGIGYEVDVIITQALTCNSPSTPLYPPLDDNYDTTYDLLLCHKHVPLAAFNLLADSTLSPVSIFVPSPDQLMGIEAPLFGTSSDGVDGAVLQIDMSVVGPRHQPVVSLFNTFVETNVMRFEFYGTNDATKLGTHIFDSIVSLTDVSLAAYDTYKYINIFAPGTAVMLNSFSYGDCDLSSRGLHQIVQQFST
jgi:hypothetical protein